MVERQPAVELRDHPVPVDQNIKGDDRRDDQEREEIEQRRSARHQPSECVEKPLRALRDEVADRFLNLRARQLLAEAEASSHWPPYFAMNALPCSTANA